MFPYLYRYALQKANNRLLKILLEVVKTTAAVEETIGRHVLGILDRSSKGQSSACLIWMSEAETPIKSCVHEEHTGGKSFICCWNYHHYLQQILLSSKHLTMCRKYRRENIKVFSNKKTSKHKYTRAGLLKRALLLAFARECIRVSLHITQGYYCATSTKCCLISSVKEKFHITTRDS